MLRLVRYANISNRYIKNPATRRISQRTFNNFTYTNSPGNRSIDTTKNSCNNTDSLRNIVNNVKENMEEKCMKEIYNIVESRLFKAQENGYLTKIANDGYTSYRLCDNHDVNKLLPQKYRLSGLAVPYMEVFVKKYLYLHGFKLKIVEQRWYNRSHIAIEW